MHLATSITTPVTTTSPTSQAAPVVRLRSPGATAAPTNSATTQTPLSGMTTSTSSNTLRAAAEGQKGRPNLIAVEGQKTIAQLQSERAAHLMQYYHPSASSSGQTQNQQATRQQGSPNAPNRILQERPRASPPPAQQASGSPRSTPTQQVTTATKAGHVQHTQGSKMVATGGQRGSPGSHPAGHSPNSASVVNSGGARTKTSAQLTAGSPPENVSASKSRTRGPSVTEASTEGHSNGQTTVVSSSNSSSTAVLRNSPSNQAPSPGQQVVKQGTNHTASAKAKRQSAHIPLTAFDIRLHTQKPRRYSDSDHNPDRPRVITRSILQQATPACSHHPQCKHAVGVTASNSPTASSPPTVPVRDSASLLPSQQLFVTKVEKVGLSAAAACRFFNFVTCIKLDYSKLKSIHLLEHMIFTFRVKNVDL